MQTADGLELEKELNSSAEELKKIVEQVSPEDALKHYDPESWSIADILEHVGLVEKGFSSRIAASPLSTEPVLDSGKESGLRERVSGRVQRIDAPEATKPRGQFSNKAEALVAFEDSCQAVLRVLSDKEESLRLLQVSHPLLGIISGYEAFVVIAAHRVRHVGQVREMLGKFV